MRKSFKSFLHLLLFVAKEAGLNRQANISFLLQIVLEYMLTPIFSVRNRDLSWPEEMNTLVETRNFRERSNTGENYVCCCIMFSGRLPMKIGV